MKNQEKEKIENLVKKNSPIQAIKHPCHAY